MLFVNNDDISLCVRDKKIHRMTHITRGDEKTTMRRRGLVMRAGKKRRQLRHVLHSWNRKTFSYGAKLHY
uniref:BZIP domain-containing protein n=1 Tax=Parascaris univalens TaxID=6257 RepID=A0A915B1Y2_PARUN